MKSLKKKLLELSGIKRREYHPLIHRVHKKYKISRKTLLYVKEYGPHSNVPKTIIRESVRILLFASIISSFGGFALEHIKVVFVSILPLVILLPVLNDMIGDYGTIVSSRFSTLLHTGKIRGSWYKNLELKRLFFQIIVISFIMVIISVIIALAVSGLQGYMLDWMAAYKILLIGIIDTGLVVGILFLLAIFAGFHFYKKGEDPNNFLIPITTSVADFSNMIVLTVLALLFF